jgi:hypothetical protein
MACLVDFYCVSEFGLERHEGRRLGCSAGLVGHKSRASPEFLHAVKQVLQHFNSQGITAQSLFFADHGQLEIHIEGLEVFMRLFEGEVVGYKAGEGFFIQEGARHKARTALGEKVRLVTLEMA